MQHTISSLPTPIPSHEQLWLDLLDRKATHQPLYGVSIRRRVITGVMKCLHADHAVQQHRCERPTQWTLHDVDNEGRHDGNR